MLTAIVSLLALGIVWAKQKPQNRKSSGPAEGFLADEQRALNFYKVFSAVYDILNPRLYTDSMRKEMVSQIQDGVNLRVLDVGCGTGYTTKGVLELKNSREVVALDMNPVQLKRAVKNLSRQKDKAFILRGDADNLPFADQSFDAVVSVGAVEYFPDPNKVLKEFARVTRPQGTIIVGGPAIDWFRKLAMNKIFYTPSAAELQNAFLKANLTNINSEMTGVKTFFGTSNYVVFATGKKPN